jgi:transcription elongation GreA/GreB family factor
LDETTRDDLFLDAVDAIVLDALARIGDDPRARFAFFRRLLAVARIQRDLRHWSARQRTAEVVASPVSTGKVRFGSSVALQKRDGEGIRYQIVGEDEADPASGKISYVSPVARLLIGAAVGDVVTLADSEAEILEIG